MAKARRAAPQRSRALIPIVVVLAAVAVALAVWRLQAVASSAGPAADPSDTSPSAPSSSQQTSAAPSSSAPSSAKPSPSATESTESNAAVAALEACRARVAAGDDEIDAASTGVGHWSEHVQAQTDANAQKITVDDMTAIFKRTRLAGPDDLKTYDAAVKERQDADGSCGSRKDASSETSAALKSCQQRLDAQDDVIDAGAAAMADWRSHQAAMYRSRHEHVNGAQDIWISAWRAAPPHIEAFDKAKKSYDDAPSCAA